MFDLVASNCRQRARNEPKDRCCGFIAGVVILMLLSLPQSSLAGNETHADKAFSVLGAKYVDQYPALSPIHATGLGDHRFDGQLDDVSQAARERQKRWTREFIASVDRIDPNELSRQNQVDYALLKHSLEFDLWRLRELQEWAWNPLVYTSLTGDAIYGLMARDFEPETDRLQSVAERLEQLPRFLAQVRENLEPHRVPPIHAETAIAQNRGVLTMLDTMIQPRLKVLSQRRRERLANSIQIAEKAIRKHQSWLESELKPNAKGNFRIGRELFDKKLALTLHSPLTRQQIRDIGDRRVSELHEQMYEIAIEVYRKQYPLTQFPKNPSNDYRRTIIRFALEKAYADTPAADGIVRTIKESVAQTIDFVRDKKLATIPTQTLEVIIMPEYRRGVSGAYCDSPGPLEANQKTFYAVSPIPKNWSDKQVKSFLREYNTRSLDVLTIHEAMPGHFHQLAHANRYPGKLRHMFESGVFVEGWAVYTEWMMCEEGFRDGDPLLKLITLKWYLRDVTNAILDQAVHVDGISRYDAMQLMVEDAFQEEREAAGKWVRAQLTSAQLSTYFVGYLEHVNLRRQAEQKWGDKFDLKSFHDKALSFGSPPPQFVEALMFNTPVPTTGISPKR